MFSANASGDSNIGREDDLAERIRNVGKVDFWNLMTNKDAGSQLQSAVSWQRGQLVGLPVDKV